MSTPTTLESQPTSLPSPHASIDIASARGQFALQVFDRLWQRYRSRVSYVVEYEKVVQATGGTFVNDHIAFRTFACQQPTVGIQTISRLFEALGYVAAGVYHFADKHLNAIHLEFPHPQFPKLFISELKTWELAPTDRRIVRDTLASHRPALDDRTLSALRGLDQDDAARAELLDTVVAYLETLPWEPPEFDNVRQLNTVSQYGAWVLVHGYNVNHFTALINSHGVAELSDIEKTLAALRSAGVPLKPEIEGAPGSKLRQSSTEAVLLDVDVRQQGTPIRRPWTYAYFEFAERGTEIDAASGETRRFEGFLGPQATQLFEMTNVATTRGASPPAA